MADKIIVLVVLAGAIVFFMKEWLRIDVVALGVLAVLIGLNILEVDEAFAAAFDPSVFVIACMFVLSKAVLKTGLAEVIGDRVTNLSGDSEVKLLLVVCTTTALLSAFVTNTAVVAIFLPIVIETCSRHKINASRILMPMAFASLLGGVVTLIGTSTNLVVRGVAREVLKGDQYGTLRSHLQNQAGDAWPLTMFDFTPAGLALAAAGLAYVVIAMPRFLAKRSAEESVFDDYNVKEFLSEVLVGADSSTVGKRIVELQYGEKYDVTIVGVVHEGKTSFAPSRNFVVQEGDTLLVQGGVQNILDLRRENRLQIKDEIRVENRVLRSLDVIMAEAVIAPGSSLIGRTLKQVSFRDTYGLTALAVYRHGLSIVTNISKLELHLGDTLLIQGHVAGIERLRDNVDFIVLEEVPSHKMGLTKWPFTLLTVLGMVAAAFLGWLSIEAAALIACLLMVVSRCITMEDAFEAIDWRIICLLVGLLPLGKAIGTTGIATSVAHFMADLSGGSGYNTLLVLATLYLLTNLLTQVVAKGSAAIMTPVAIGLAAELGNDKIKPFLLAVAFASSFGFISPIGHQCCALVMGPGKYRFANYMKAGAVLSVLMFFATVGTLYVLYLL